jgi:hypothetical protein
MKTIIDSSRNFHIPSNFLEFRTQYPMYLRNFVRRYMRRCPIQEQLDRESELTYFLLTLPTQSKYRHPGTNGILGGCTDRIMTFDPERSHGDSAGHFFGYLNRILRNHFFSLEAKAQSNPATRRGTLRIAVDNELFQGAGDEINDERISAQDHPQFSRSRENPIQHAMVSKFIEFVRTHNRELIPVLESISSCSTYSEAQADLGLNNRFFCRARLRLKVLYDCFSTGNPVPRQRRIYRSRNAASRVAAAPHHELNS